MPFYCQNSGGTESIGEEQRRRVIQIDSRPGWSGGANWWGAAFDPETGRLYVPSWAHFSFVVLEAGDPANSDLLADDPAAGYKLHSNLPGPQGLPLSAKPPYAVQIAALTRRCRRLPEARRRDRFGTTVERAELKDEFGGDGRQRDHEARAGAHRRPAPRHGRLSGAPLGNYVGRASAARSLTKNAKSFALQNRPGRRIESKRRLRPARLRAERRATRRTIRPQVSNLPGPQGLPLFKPPYERSERRREAVERAARRRPPRPRGAARRSSARQLRRAAARC